MLADRKLNSVLDFWLSLNSSLKLLSAIADPMNADWVR